MEEKEYVKTFRKKAAITAVQYTGFLNPVWEFTGLSYFRSPGPDAPDLADGKFVTAEVYDKIHNIWVPVRDGDWIIRGVQGEFYPCDPDVFADTYEEIT